MNLTTDQKQALAQRIYDEFSGFVKDELEYQIEDMKDNDMLSWEYYSTPEDQQEILSLVQDMVSTTVPVS